MLQVSCGVQQIIVSQVIRHGPLVVWHTCHSSWLASCAALMAVATPGKLLSVSFQLGWQCGSASPGCRSGNIACIWSQHALSPMCCTSLYCAVLWRAVLCCAALCHAAVCCAVPCRAVLCCAALRCPALRCAVLRCATLCCNGLRCAVLCCAVLCCAVLCCAVPWRAQPYRCLMPASGLSTSCLHVSAGLLASLGGCDVRLPARSVMCLCELQAALSQHYLTTRRRSLCSKQR